MPAFDEKYSDAQRDAVARAALDRGIKPHREIVRLAAAGELDGLDAFTMPVSTVASIARHYRRRRRGELASPVADAPPRDAIEMLRRRLVSMVDAELGALEKKKAGTRDAERIRQLGRATLEVARLPGPTDPRAASHATRDATGKRGPETRNGLAGALLKDHRAQGETVPDATAQHSVDGGEHSDNDALPLPQAESTRDALPGAQPSEHAEQQLA